MKFLSLLFVFSSFAHAQESVPVQENVPETREEIIERVNFNRSLAWEFAKDPNFTLTQVQDGVIVKPRTRKSKRVADPEELKKKQNLQNIWNFTMGMKFMFAKDQSYEGFAPTSGLFSLDHFEEGINLELGFRPPVGVLKRLLIGVSAGMSNGNFPQDVSGDDIKKVPEAERMHYISHDTSASMPEEPMEHGYFLEWDALYIPTGKNISAISVGFSSMRYYLADTTNNQYVGSRADNYNAKSLRLRWRILAANIGDTASVSPNIAFSISNHHTKTLAGGITISFGSHMKVKDKIEK